MKLEISSNQQVFYLTDLLFAVWAIPIQIRKLNLKLVVESDQPYTVNGIPVVNWFDFNLNQKIVIRSDQIDAMINDEDRFDYLVVENTDDHYLVDTLFRILQRISGESVIKSLSIA